MRSLGAVGCTLGCLATPESVLCSWRGTFDGASRVQRVGYGPSAELSRRSGELSGRVSGARSTSRPRCLA